jgi:hypothetical protein
MRHVLFLAIAVTLALGNAVLIPLAVYGAFHP